tara:strand:- start:439 stop:1344 length:906 start_codon:yes stop_codon:yes gene_type:complete
MSMFTHAYIEKHLGNQLDFTADLYRYKKCEKKFKELCEIHNIESAHDCTAFENIYFKTLNYTTYANMFMMCPLNFTASFDQIMDARADDVEVKDYISVIRKAQSKKGGKYRANFFTVDRDMDSVAVLPGSNKFEQHVCTVKLKQLVEENPKLVVKPHPLSDNNLISRIRELVPANQLASQMESLYDLIDKASIVYTTHISESALTGLALGKEVEPIDRHTHRLHGSFSHINFVIFSALDPIKEMNKIFSSPKSGIINLDIDTDWEYKMEQYIKHIMAKRAKEKGRYIYGHVKQAEHRSSNL